MNKDTAYMLARLQSLGISWDDALALRKVAMTLQRWHEKECGNSNEYGSWAIERDPATEVPFLVHHRYNHGKGPDTVTHTRIADKEKGAHKRLAAIMAKYPALIAYVQGDPRGAPLYIVLKSDIPKLTREEWLKCGPVDKSEEGFKHAQERQIESYYSRGIAVYK